MITISSISVNNPQADGRRIIHEVHIDDAGVEYGVDYMAAPNDDLDAHLAASVQKINTVIASIAAQAIQSEIDANMTAIRTLGSLAVPTFNSSSVPLNVAALRAIYLTVTKTDAVFIGDYLNSLSDAQLRSAFSLSAASVIQLRSTYLVPAAATATTIRNSVGA